MPQQIGLPLASVTMGIHIEDLEKTITEAIATKEKIAHELRDKDGRVYEMRVRPYFDEKGKVDGAVLAFIDVSELDKARRLAAVGETAGMVGHDIRNPFQAITGGLYLASR